MWSLGHLLWPKTLLLRNCLNVLINSPHELLRFNRYSFYIYLI
jgi:hypothetical protein